MNGFAAFDNIIDTTVKLFLPVFLPIVGAVSLITVLIWTIRIIRQQRVLKYSITLVELKVNKLPYLVLDAALILCLFGSVFQLVAPSQNMLDVFLKYFGTGVLEARITLTGAVAVSAAGTLLSGVLTFTKCAVVDRGVYTGTRFLDWYHVYDYFMDEKTVVLSSNRNGPLTMLGTTPPLKFAKNDNDKLKFILNKNKNKFIPRFELR